VLLLNNQLPKHQHQDNKPPVKRRLSPMYVNQMITVNQDVVDSIQRNVQVPLLLKLEMVVVSMLKVNEMDWLLVD
jgi:hypothetical protein